MNTKNTLEYLSNILSKAITEQDEISLSSAQKSRVHDWLIKNNISFNESILSRRFTVSQLINGGSDIYHSQVVSRGIFALPNELNTQNIQVGIDIQRVGELFPLSLPFDPKSDKDLIKIFTIKELSYAQTKVDPEATLAGIFCAKEAILKASNLGKELNQIEVLPDESGQPKSIGFSLSISHSGGYAVAIAVASYKDALFQKSGTCNQINDSNLHVSERPGIIFNLRWIDLALIIAIAGVAYKVL